LVPGAPNTLLKMPPSTASLLEPNGFSAVAGSLLASAAARAPLLIP
jgi:hypothetical protein